ncbi:MAG: VTT domain-containing protein, partial [bacterium]|nr:VTT domain-containing protein [bacterium]
SVIAFMLARKYGANLVKKFLPIEKIYKFEKKIPEKHLFLTVAFLTAVVAMDGISYVFGLFSKMSLRDYTLATIIGLIPFSFTSAYLGSVPFYYTILFLLTGLAILTIGIIIAYFKKKIGKRKE